MKNRLKPTRDATPLSWTGTAASAHSFALPIKRQCLPFVPLKTMLALLHSRLLHSRLATEDLADHTCRDDRRIDMPSLLGARLVLAAAKREITITRHRSGALIVNGLVA